MKTFAITFTIGVAIIIGYMTGVSYTAAFLTGTTPMQAISTFLIYMTGLGIFGALIAAATGLLDKD